MKAIFKSVIPFSEADAFTDAPTLWEMRGDEFTITFSIPLFTFNKYELYRKIVQGVKLRLLLGKEVEISLDRLLSNRDNEHLKTIELLNYALTTFKNEHGSIPNTFTDLIIDISEPIDVTLCTEQMEVYFRKNGIPWVAPENPKEHPEDIRQALKYIAANTLTIESIVKVLQQIETVNVEVKKKLQAPKNETESDKLKKPRLKLLSRLLGKN